MELAHSLCLNVDVADKLSEHKRPVFVYEWLRFLEKVLSAARRVIYFIVSIEFSFICLSFI